MRGSPRVVVPIAALAIGMVLVLAAYGYVYSRPMAPLVLLAAGASLGFTGWGNATYRAWNVTGMGAHLQGAWTTSNGTQFRFGLGGPPSLLLVPVTIVCRGAFDMDLPPGGYFLAFSGAAGTTLTVTDGLTVLPSNHVVREAAAGPGNALVPCTAP